RLLRLEFNLPKKYPLMSFIYSVFIFTVLIEVVGAIVLYYGFRAEEVANPLWKAIFHSISAFCTAGFSLFDDSMSAYTDNNLITNTILVLSLLGSIGFIVLLDLWMRLIRKRKRISLTTKIILLSTFFLWMSSSVLLFFSDSKLSSLGWEGVRLSIFQSISAHTTVGFNNYNLDIIGPAGIFILIIIMIIGASPAGTGGGIKTTSISAMIAVLTSVLQRKRHVTFFQKEIPASNIYLAVSSVMFYAVILLIGTWAILITDGDHFKFEELLFEVASALSTVGLSTGITGELSDMSKLIISSLMFVGRLGVLTFGFALISKAPLLRHKPEVEDVAI
ncbi:potassium-transporting ATPase subunit KdpA, partial [Saprospiraceae bacterium]|nr:potassium-transporting ATPase subunit KdpA [Saprospiraceae bacterium]